MMWECIIDTKTTGELEQLFATAYKNQSSNRIPKCIHLPLIEIQNLTPPKEKILALLGQITHLNWVIVSSKNSLKHCPKIILNELQKRQIKVAAVGLASSKTAQNFGLNVSMVSPTNSLEGLMQSDELLEGEAFLFLKGRFGNMSLIELLESQKRQVFILESSLIFFQRDQVYTN